MRESCFRLALHGDSRYKFWELLNGRKVADTDRAGVHIALEIDPAVVKRFRESVEGLAIASVKAKAAMAMLGIEMRKPIRPIKLSGKVPYALPSSLNLIHDVRASER